MSGCGRRMKSEMTPPSLAHFAARYGADALAHGVRWSTCPDLGPTLSVVGLWILLVGFRG